MNYIHILFCALIALSPFGVRAATVNANFTSVNSVPITDAGYTATGNDLAISLGFTPPTGTSLTVVKNTGLPFISGQFSNLVQGQVVNLTYDGITYKFVANYYGGTGNDLVLHWAYQDVIAWGRNSKVPKGVPQNGVLIGKTVVSVSAGEQHSVALCSDGTVVSWGANYYGQLGNNSTMSSSVPVLVNQNGVLAGKTVVSIAAGGRSGGYGFSLALCSDGTMASWGSNYSKTLGNGINNWIDSSVPVLVIHTGVLAGKSVVSIAAGTEHCLALCSDGTLVAWGTGGQLGNNSTKDSSVPVLVSQSGILSDKTVQSIAAGSHSLALCTDGTVAAWGWNNNGQLGNGTTTNSIVPIDVAASGILASKSVVAISAGYGHSIALCSDGTVATWGYNAYGQLGNNGTINSTVPVSVSQSEALDSKEVVEVDAGYFHSLARCSDGVLVTWGNNSYGELGNNSSTNSSAPVAVTQNEIMAGKTVISISGGDHSSLALAIAPNSSDLAGIGLSSGSLIPSFSPEITSYTSSVSNAASSITISPSSAANMANIEVNGTAVYSGGLSPEIPLEVGLNTISVVVTAPDGVRTKAYTVTVTRLPSSIATLSGLVPSSGTLNPTFATGTTSYTASVANSTTSITVSPTVTDATASIKVNGNTVTSGSASTPIPLNVGTNTLTILVTAQDGTTTETYSVVVTRKSAVSTLSGLALSTGSLSPAFDSATRSYTTSIPQATGSITLTPVVTDSAATVKVNGTAVATGSASSAIPLLGMAATTVTILVTAEDPAFTTTYTLTVAERILSSPNGVSVTSTGFTAAGNAARFALGFAPATGSSLTLVNNTGIGLISGEFQNLRHGQELVLSYGGRDYRFVVDYFGGTGNDLVLQWADNGLIGWGKNAEGQLGIGSLADRSVPTDLVASGLLSGKKVAAVSAGQFHTLALSSDGTVTSWGLNSSGQLGNNSTTNSSLPEAVNRPGFLDGKQVVAVAAGGNFSLALCADGTLASWGDNSSGQLGDGSTKVNSIVPLDITGKGALSGRTVVSISAGERHALAICSDGILVSWGANESGQLGNGTTQGSNLPVLVSAGGALAGKSVRSISAGGKHSLALSTDGSMAAWGANQAGQLGNNSTTASSVPVAVPRQGAIAGKTVIGLSAGGDHSLAVCSDGTVAAWGLNSSGQLGNASNNTSYVPVAVTMTTGALLNKRVVSVSASAAHSLALCLDETVVAWGANPNGSLGNNSTTTSNIPVAVTGAGVLSSKKVAAVNAGGAQSFALCTDGSLAGWGLNTYGQLGNNSSETARVPVAVTTTSGALFGKTVVSISVGHAHALVRFSDGGMAAWGGNAEGQLGNNTTTNSNIPVEVFKGGILAGKTVAAVSAGYAHNVALCSDGTVATWGSNSWGQLGNGSSIVSSVIPVNITGLGALAGRTVVAVSAGANHCLALCSDGRVAAWGRGDSGQLGVGGFSTSSLPVEVKWDGVLTGKSVVEISAGADHSLARCSDGTLVAWGSNVFGQLGINLGGNRAAPVLVETGSGALMGKTVVATAAGTTHSLALCSDGTLAAWGSNAEGQLGSIGTNGSYVPISVTTNIGALYGKTVRRIACGQYHNLALCTDGSLAAWGQGTSGQLGNSSVVNSDIPESVTSAGVLSGKSVWTIASGGSSSFVLAGAPMLPSLSNLTLNAGSLSPAFSPETTSYAASFANSVSSVILKPSAADSTAVVKVNGTVVPSGSASAPIPLSFGTNTITITITATAQDGMTTKTYTVTVTRAASSVATLSGLALTTGTLSPAFSSETTTYTSSASNTTSSLKVNPTATVSTAMIKINGTAVLSGSASSSIPLSFGTNTIAIQVMAQDGTTAMTYTVKVTRSASSVNTLSGLALKSATLSPKFNKTKSVYTASVASSVSSLKVRPTATSNLATIKVNGSKVKSGSLSKAIALKRGKNTIKVVVTAQDGTTKTYRITVTRGGVAKAIAISAARNSSIQKRAIPEIAEITKTIVEEQPYLQITLMKGNENTTRVVEVSSNLVDWYSGHHHTTTLIDDESMLRVRDNTSIKSGKMRYIRLRQIP